jgi:hypothetical protein
VKNKLRPSSSVKLAAVYSSEMLAYTDIFTGVRISNLRQAIAKLKLSHYTPRRRFGGEVV